VDWKFDVRYFWNLGSSIIVRKSLKVTARKIFVRCLKAVLLNLQSELTCLWARLARDKLKIGYFDCHSSGHIMNR
jgi:hypothetical protein